MLERTQVRLLPTASRVADNAPMVGVCCNVCRTCRTTNVASFALAAVVGGIAAVAHFARRLLGRA